MDWKVKRLKEKEEKLRKKIKELQEKKEAIKKELEAKRLIASLLPNFVFPLSVWLFYKKKTFTISSPKELACLVFLFRCNRGKAVKNPKQCLTNLIKELEDLNKLVENDFLKEVISEVKKEIEKISQLSDKELIGCLQQLQRLQLHEKFLAVAKVLFKEQPGKPSHS